MTGRPVRRIYPVMFCFVAAALTLACVFPLFPFVSTAEMGVLKVDINYTDSFYRETFDYTRDAENIQHFVLVVPTGEVDRLGARDAFRIFYPGMEEDDPNLQWVRDHLYEAPEGYFSGEFEPGTYSVAVVFVAAPLSREEAGVSEDVILYPGNTGGGASTDYQPVEIEAGQTTEVEIIMTDDNGWACPWLYVYNGHAFDRRTEILRNVHSQQTETTALGMVPVVDGAVVLQISEEKDEISTLDEFYLIVDGVVVYAGLDDLSARDDQKVLTLARGESVTLRFKLPAAFAGREQVRVSVVVTGYYERLE